MSKLRSFASGKQELDEINQQLSKNGISSASSSEEKLRALWKLYQRAEADVKSASDSMEELQKKQAEEMKEVESYVENIRKLSEERESLTQEFEAENEQLKQENKKLKKEKEEANKEIQQMLKQEGFDDLAKGTTSEAIAYFLVERTRLSDKVDAERRKSLTNEPANKLDQSSVTRLEQQNKRLEQESRQQIQKVKELETELKMLRNRLEKEKETHHKEVEKVQKKADERLKSSSALDEVTTQLREAKRKLEQELTTMKYRMKTSEEEKEKINKKVKELTESLEAERKRRSSYEGTIIKLKHLLDSNRKTISGLEEDNKSLSDEKKTLESKYNFLQKDVQGRQDVVSPSKTESLRSDGDLVAQLQGEIELLQKQNKTCVARLEETMISLESEKMKCRQLERKLSTTEEKWEEVVKRYRNNERELNSKLDKLTKDLEGSKTQVSNNQLEILRLQAENKRVLSSSNSEKDRVREQLQLEQNILNKEADRHRETITDLEGLVDGLKKDRDVLAHELKAMIAKEQKHKDWAGSVDMIDRENRELKDKRGVRFLTPSRSPSPSASPCIQALESSLGKHTTLQQELEVEKRKNKDLITQLEVTKQSLKIAEQTADQLQETLGRKSVELVKQFDSSREGKTKMETELLTAKQELLEEKTMAARDKTNLGLALEREEKRVQDLNTQLGEKNEEISQLRREVGRLSLGTSRSEEKVQEESRRRNDIESRNKLLEEEMSKLWSQMKGMMDKLSESEKAKQDVEAELTRIPELQTELDQTSLRLQATEAQLKEYGALKVELQDRKDEIVRLKGQVHDDKLQKSVMQQQIEDLRLQSKAGREMEDQLRRENSELRDQLLNIQTKLNVAEDTSRSYNDKHNMSEQSRTSLLQQVGTLQGENDSLRQELLRVSGQLDAQLRKYQDHKLNTKTKMQQAREIFNKHKGMLGDSLIKLQEELNAAKADLQKTSDVKLNVDNKHQELLAEHRELLAKMAELEEVTRDQGRDIATQDYRVKFLERENAMLQDRIDTLSKQRMALEKLVREYRLEKQKEEINKTIGTTSNSTTNLGLMSQAPGSSLGYSLTKTSPSSGMGTSLSYLSSVDVPNGHPDGLLVRAGHHNGHDLQSSLSHQLQSPSGTYDSNGGSI